MNPVLAARTSARAWLGAAAPVPVTSARTMAEAISNGIRVDPIHSPSRIAASEAASTASRRTPMRSSTASADSRRWPWTVASVTACR